MSDATIKHDGLRFARPGDCGPVLTVASAWPSHFVPRGLRALADDFEKHHAAVVEAGGDIVAFVVWLETSLELEILWLATAPSETRRGHATALVELAASQHRGQCRVVAKTASLDSQLEGTDLDGSKFASAIAFFEAVGFEQDCRVESYWGPGDHALFLSKALYK